MASEGGRRRRLEERFAERMDQRDAQRLEPKRKGQPPRPDGAHSCVYLGGAGMPLAPNHGYWFAVRQDHLAWLAGDGSPSLTLHYDAVLDASTAGAGTVNPGGGFIGGGVGLEGAATGIAAAAVPNALTQRSRIDSVLRIVTQCAEGLFAFRRQSPSEFISSWRPCASLRASASHHRHEPAKSAVPRSLRHLSA